MAVRLQKMYAELNRMHAVCLGAYDYSVHLQQQKYLGRIIDENMLLCGDNDVLKKALQRLRSIEQIRSMLSIERHRLAVNIAKCKGVYCPGLLTVHLKISNYVPHSPAPRRAAIVCFNRASARVFAGVDGLCPSTARVGRHRSRAGRRDGDDDNACDCASDVDCRIKPLSTHPTSSFPLAHAVVAACRLCCTRCSPGRAGRLF